MVEYKQRCADILAHVAANPMCNAAEIIAATGHDEERVRYAVYRLTVAGHLQYAEPPLRGIARRYKVDGVPTQHKQTLGDKIFAFVSAHPGTLREPIIRLVGRTSGGGALCVLINNGRLRGELGMTGVKYYVV
jgi:hypothetical protein